MGEGLRVLAAISEHTVRSLPRSPPSAVQRGNRIHQRRRCLRVVPVRAGTPAPGTRQSTRHPAQHQAPSTLAPGTTCA